MKSKLLTIVLVTLATIFCVFACVALDREPQFTARAEYSINWEQAGAAEADFNPEKFRQEYLAAIASFKPGEPLIADMAKVCGLSAQQAALLQKKLRRVKISVTGTNEEGEWFCVQFTDNDKAFALKAADFLTKRFVNKINNKFKVKSVGQTLSSISDNASVRENDARIREDLASLKQLQRESYSTERAERVSELEEKLEKNDWDKLITGIQALGHGVNAFNTPAKIQRSAVIETR